MKTVPDRSRTSHFVVTILLLLCVLLCFSPTVAWADQPYRNPQGSLKLGFGIGLGENADGEGLTVATGAHLGYAVLTGVVPGIRGLVLFSDSVGAELAGTLTLTPPLSYYLVPYVVGELGGRFDQVGTGLLYGAGGGVYVGQPKSKYAVQVGYVFRTIDYGASGKFDASSPTVTVSIRFK